MTSLEKSQRSHADWRRLLPPEAYEVLFEEDTERPFTSPLHDEKRNGTYVCAACFLPLFESSAKYDSGTGWPSFFRPIDGHLATKRDFRLIWPRTEYHCARCGGHQGHVFKDGPPPSGQRCRVAAHPSPSTGKAHRKSFFGRPFRYEGVTVLRDEIF